jgi:hypothetical protein
MANNSKKSSARRSFSWIHFYGIGLGVLLAGLAIWRSTPLMTGELSAAHAAIETQCEACHTPFRGVQDASCRSCHPEIGGDSPSIIHRRVKGNCTSCHFEHRSRAYPLRLADVDVFDHELSGFSLTKHHRGVGCLTCHKAARPFYEVPKQCEDCHPNWNPANFDHARITGIPLIRHAGLSCADCHPGKNYTAPAKCNACHEPAVLYHSGQRL